MREILFKAKRWSDGKWIVGDLLQFQDNTVIHWYSEGCRVSDDVDPSTVCQYTGLTDKNGRKIFEGDIVDCKTTLYFMHEFEVSFDQETASWIIKNPLNKYKMDSSFDYRVVGNIHDRP